MAKKKKKTVTKKTSSKAVKKTAPKKSTKTKTVKKKTASGKSTTTKKSTKKKTVKKKTTRKKTSAKKAAPKKDTKKTTRKIKKSTRAASVRANSKRAAAPIGFDQGKPLRKSPLTNKQIDHFRQLLLEKRAELIGDVNSMETEALRTSRMDATGDLSSMPIHMADIGTDNYEQEFALGLMDSERKLLREILDALTRIDEGVYGVCEGTGQAIPLARLEANPWARYCVQYAEMVEKGLITEGEKTYNEDDFEDEEDEDLETAEAESEEEQDEDTDDEIEDDYDHHFVDEQDEDDDEDDDNTYFDYIEDDED